MASDINDLTIVGRLTKDGELTYTNSGVAVLKLSIANNWSKKVGDAWEDQTNFFDVTLLGRRAEALTQYLLKGVQIAVSGELRQDRWKDNNSGDNRSRVSIKANNIQLLGSKQQEQQQSVGNYQNNQQSYQNQGGNGFDSDSIPF